jgi:hypothetical protein
VCAMHDGSLVAVVGEGPRQEALRAIADTATDATPFLGDLRDYALEVAQEEPERRWFRAVLAREPDNPHDSNAIAVYAEGGQHVGYLSQEHASTYRQVFESVAKRGYEGATCPAMLAGGGDKHYGVVLALSVPVTSWGTCTPRSTQRSVLSGPVQKRSAGRRFLKPPSAANRGTRSRRHTATRPPAGPMQPLALTRSATDLSSHGAAVGVRASLRAHSPVLAPR